MVAKRKKLEQEAEKKRLEEEADWSANDETGDGHRFIIPMIQGIYVLWRNK